MAGWAGLCKGEQRDVTKEAGNRKKGEEEERSTGGWRDSIEMA